MGGGSIVSIKDKVARGQLSAYKAETAKSKNLFDKYKTVDNYKRGYTNGNPSVQVGSYYTDYIPVEAGLTYYCNAKYLHLCFFDINKIFVSGAITGSTGESFVVPQGCVYLVFTAALNTRDTTQLELGSVGTNYVPYNYYHRNILETYSFFEQAYIYNRKLVGNQVYSLASNALYTGVDVGVGNVPISMKCKVVFNQTDSLVALISNPNGLTAISHITQKSLHILFKATEVLVELLDDQVTTILYTHTYATPCLMDGYTEYTFGWSVSGNVLTLTLPDGTFTYTDSAIPLHLGRYCTFEHFSSTSGTQLHASFTYFEVTANNNYLLKDNFRRQNGAIGNAPTGQSYVQITSKDS